MHDTTERTVRILWILPYPPLPVTTGGRRRVFSLLKELSDRHEIAIVAYRRGDPPETEHENRKYCSDFRLESRRSTRHPLNLVSWIFGDLPFMVIANKPTRDMIMTLKTAVSEFRPDIVHCEHFHMWESVSRARDDTWPPVILSQQGIEYVVTQRYLDITKNPAKRIALSVELKKARSYEINVCREADTVILVSDRDRELLHECCSVKRVRVVPNGVDPAYFKPRIGNKPRKPVLLFIGTFSFFGNRDALRYSVFELLPRIRERFPETVLRVIGERPPDIRAPGVEILGRIPDIRPHLQESSLLIAPLRTGSGTKLKILEAMACELPFVATSIGAEGIRDVEKAGLVADDTEGLIEAVYALLDAPGVGDERGRAGRRIVEQNYTWAISARKLESVWLETADSSGKGNNGGTGSH